MSDLEKLKKTFDEIGVKYEERKQNVIDTELWVREKPYDSRNIFSCVFAFENGKLTEID